MYVSQHIRFYIKIVLFWTVSGFLFSRIAYNAGIIITILSLLIYFTLKKEERYIFILSAVPMASIFKISIGLPSSIILLYLIYIFENIYEKKTVRKDLMLSLIVLLFSQVIALLAFGSGIISAISFFVNIIFCGISFESLQDKENRELLFHHCGFAFSLVMCINILLATIFPNMALQIGYEKQIALERAGRFAALNGDPNYYSQLVSVALCFMAVGIFNKGQSKQQRFISVAIFAYLLIYGLSSGSKSFVLVLLILLILLVILLIRNSQRDRSFLIKICLIGLTGLVVGIYLFNDIILPLFIERSLDNTTLLSNRDIIWRNYLDNFADHPLVWLIGTGIMNGGNILANGAAAHNVYIELVAETGIIGLSSILYTLSSVFKKFKLLLHNINMLFIWALLITSLSLSLSSNDAMFVILPIVALIGDRDERLYQKTELLRCSNRD